MTETSRAARIRCREIMTSNVQTATREMSLSQVAVMMRDGDMGSIPVVGAVSLKPDDLELGRKIVKEIIEELRFED